MRASVEVHLRREAVEKIARIAAAEVEIGGGELRVRPRSVEGARRAIVAAAQQGLCFGRDGLRLDRSGLCHVGLVDHRSMWIHCGAGAPLALVERALRRAGLTLGSQPPSIFGGDVADWLEGRYAGRRAMDGRLEPGVAAIEGVLPDGTPLSTRAAPRSAAGPAVAHLILGGGGGCGHLLGATLKAQPLLRQREQIAVEGAPVSLARLLAALLRTQLPPWEARYAGPAGEGAAGRLELVWPVEREDQRVAVQSFRRRVAEAGLQVMKCDAAPYEARGAEAAAEAEVPCAGWPALFGSPGPGRSLRLVRLSPESLVAAGDLPAGLQTTRRHGALFSRIEAAVRSTGAGAQAGAPA